MESTTEINVQQLRKIEGSRYLDFQKVSAKLKELVEVRKRYADHYSSPSADDERKISAINGVVWCNEEIKRLLFM